MAKIPPALQAMLDRLEEVLQAAVLESVSKLKSRVVMTDLVRAIEAGNAEDVFKALNLSDEFFDQISDAVRANYAAAGEAAISAAAKGFPRSTRLGIVFGMRSPEAEAWMASRSSNLIVEITASTREAVRGVLTNGLSQGRNPKRVAVDLIGQMTRATGERTGGVIGLNSYLTGMLENAKSEIRSSDPALLRNFLNRKLRDKRFDRSIQAAIDSGKGLTVETQEKILAQFSDSLLRFRAKAIARTEATATLNAARHEAVGQLVRKGQVSEEDIVRRWRSAGDDGHTRDTHLSMENQTVVGLREPFTSPSGARLMHPGDTSLGAGPEETVNCRCYEEVKIDYVAAQARIERANSGR